MHGDSLRVDLTGLDVGASHPSYTMTATLVDPNLTLANGTSSVTETFVVDTRALDIPAADIVFKNHDKEAVITLPEPGIVTGVTINGQTFTGGATKDHRVWRVPVKVSGFIAAGTAITVTYSDGFGHSGSGVGTVTGILDSVCEPIIMTSPIFEGMTAIAGITEPNARAFLHLPGQEEPIEMDVDQFGRFWFDEAQEKLLSALTGGQTFTVAVTDIAGNREASSFTIPASVRTDENGVEYPVSISSKVYPLGKLISGADADGELFWAMATPVALSDFTSKAGEPATVTLPLMPGGLYQVGTMTLTLTDQGVVVTRELTGLNEENSTLLSDTLTVYSEEPSVETLTETQGTAAQYGQPIPLAKGQTLWLCAEMNVEMHAAVMAETLPELDMPVLVDIEAYIEYGNK